MPENMSISVNGQSQVPPGFRFHPTEEELLQYYLRKKVSYEKIDLDVIRDVDLNKLEPWDIQGVIDIQLFNTLSCILSVWFHILDVFLDVYCEVNSYSFHVSNMIFYFSTSFQTFRQCVIQSNSCLFDEQLNL